MSNDTIQEVINDTVDLAAHCKVLKTSLALKGIATRLLKLVDAGLFVTPKAAADAARTASETHAREMPQIRDYRTTYIAGKDVYSLMALDDSEAHNQYTIFCRKENGQFAGRFFINNELKFTVTVPSLLRCRHITLSAANSYLHMNDRAMARRHKRRERARAAAALSPEAELAETVKRQKEEC